MNSYVSRVYGDDFDVVRMDFDLDVWDVVRSNIPTREIADRVKQASGGRVQIQMFLDKTIFKSKIKRLKEQHASH